ncbi:MAG TPA: DUF2182 domain-containing protein, partial [Casimicrobiaceae bacterium]|nr:DUF2182 domain-containing protein [Casimicrobiaceae bacterium]
MEGASLLERALRRDRAIVVAGLLAVVVLAWLELLREVAAMAGMATAPTGMPGVAMERMAMPDMAMPAATMSASHALAIGAMWAVMMAAMMLPAASPMILFYTRIAGERGATRTAAGAT